MVQQKVYRNIKMREKNFFIKALDCLFYSWGGDTPSEVFWGCNDLLEWFEQEYKVKLNIRFDEGNPNSNYDDVIKAIRNA
jgi:hypothetical protein